MPERLSSDSDSNREPPILSPEIEEFLIRASKSLDKPLPQRFIDKFLPGIKTRCVLATLGSFALIIACGKSATWETGSPTPVTTASLTPRGVPTVSKVRTVVAREWPTPIPIMLPPPATKNTDSNLSGEDFQPNLR